MGGWSYSFRLNFRGKKFKFFSKFALNCFDLLSSLKICVCGDDDRVAAPYTHLSLRALT